ncbi:uncharacterized protein LOC124456951 [Xenia sp. Carnegie-2017]|uniref:uncharacterized protein LOC124456951 n=1 Tax=Xenia sp. Carnegie-2017 TaxID=2897299 RepID=UPI001F036D0F|nr:uncharacterized protein LOC124456951 [Xenia sp. Carnegie-2017]
MADRSNDRVHEMVHDSNKKNRAKKERVWTETELKYFAIVLADEKKQYAVQLETLALKKSANLCVYEEIAKDLETYLKSDDFKEESKPRLRVKYKFLRSQWRKFTDRVKKGSGKAPIVEPEWFTIINPIFSDTMGDADVASCSGDVLLSYESENSLSDSDKEDETVDRPDTPFSNTSGLSIEATDNSGDDDVLEASTNSSSSSNTKGKHKAKLEIRPFFQKRVKSQAQAIQNMAKSFSDMGEMQRKRSELFSEAEKKRQQEFLNFQREQAELNRQHEIKMLEMIMKYSRPYQSEAPHLRPPNIQIAHQQSPHNMYPYGGFNFSQLESEVQTTLEGTTIASLGLFSV